MDLLIAAQLQAEADYLAARDGNPATRAIRKRILEELERALARAARRALQTSARRVRKRRTVRSDCRR